MDFTGDPEILLIKRVQADSDREAFDTLYEKYSGKIYNYCYGFLGNSYDADDCCQDIFVKIFRHAGSFRFESSVSTWIYRIMVNSCKDYYKRGKQMRQSRPIEEFKEESSGEASIVDKLSVSQVNEAFYVELARMKPAFRTILILRDIEGRSYEEIAAITGVAHGTVRSRIARARRCMAEKLKSFRDEL